MKRDDEALRKVRELEKRYHSDKKVYEFGEKRRDYQKGVKFAGDLDWPLRGKNTPEKEAKQVFKYHSRTNDFNLGLARGTLDYGMLKLPRGKREEGAGQVMVGAAMYERLGKGDKSWLQERLITTGQELIETKDPFATTYLPWLKKFLKRNPIRPFKKSFLSKLLQRAEDYFGRDTSSAIYNPKTDKDLETAMKYNPRSEVKRNNETTPQKKAGKNLEKEVARASSITLIISGLFLISANITGNAIASLNISSSNYVGIALFILGIALGIFSLRKRN